MFESLPSYCCCSATPRLPPYLLRYLMQPHALRGQANPRSRSGAFLGSREAAQ